MASMPIGTLNPSLPLADAGGKPDNARIHEVARKLEGQFAQMMIKCMREAGFGDSLFPGENQVFRDMYDLSLIHICCPACLPSSSAWPTCAGGRCPCWTWA